jgi:hypothetical protein
MPRTLAVTEHHARRREVRALKQADGAGIVCTGGMTLVAELAAGASSTSTGSSPAPSSSAAAEARAAPTRPFASGTVLLRCCIA